MATTQGEFVASWVRTVSKRAHEGAGGPDGGPPSRLGRVSSQPSRQLSGAGSEEERKVGSVCVLCVCGGHGGDITIVIKHQS